MKNEIIGYYPYEGGIMDGLEYQDSQTEPPCIEDSKLVAAVSD
jgi:hypothetical protein